MMESDDLTLVTESREGSTKAFEAIVDKYQRVIFNVALRMLGNYDDAQDITQVVFIKAYENLRTFNPKYKFFSWLYRIAVNEATNSLNLRKRNEPLVYDPVARDKNPEERYDDAELSRNIQKALMELNPDSRIVLVLKHFQDCSYREMSYILDIPEKTVKSRLFTARQLLGNILMRRGLVDHD